MTTDTTTTRNAQHFGDALSLLRTARRAVEAFPPTSTEDEEKELDELVSAEDAATDYLMSHDAADFVGVLAKIEIIAKNPGAPNTGAWLAGIGADVMRLADIDRSPTFDPFVWLCQFEQRGGKSGLVDVKGLRQGSLTVPLGDTPALTYARRMLDLPTHERKALDEYLLETLSAAEHGLSPKQEG